TRGKRSLFSGSRTAEEFLPRPDRAGGLRLVTQRPVDLAAPGADRQHLAILVHRCPAEVLVDDPRALAALRDRSDDQRLAEPGVTAGVDLLDAGAIGLLGADVAATVEVERELLHQALVLRVLEADRDQHEIRVEYELGAGHRRQIA